MDNRSHDNEPATSTIVASQNETNKRKRRSSISDESNQGIKRFIANTQNDEDEVSRLLELSDEMLLKILQGCDGASLYAVSK